MRMHIIRRTGALATVHPFLGHPCFVKDSDRGIAWGVLTTPSIMDLLRVVSVTGAPYREVNSKVATAPKLKVEDKDRVNNSRRIRRVKLNIVKLKGSLTKFSRGKVCYRSRMPNA